MGGALQQGETGGLTLTEDLQRAFSFPAAVRPDRKSERRVMGSLRPRERRRDFPTHQELELEVAE